jgi:hypothetical protein
MDKLRMACHTSLDLTWTSEAIASEQVCQNTVHPPALRIRVNI